MLSCRGYNRLEVPVNQPRSGDSHQKHGDRYFLGIFLLYRVTDQCAVRESGSLRTEPARVTPASCG